jgi:hypothetical protein
LTVNFIDTLAVTLVAIVRRNKKRDPARVSFVSLSFPSCLSILLPNILARNTVGYLPKYHLHTHSHQCDRQSIKEIDRQSS